MYCFSRIDVCVAGITRISSDLCVPFHRGNTAVIITKVTQYGKVIFPYFTRVNVRHPLTIKGEPTHTWHYAGISGAVPVKSLGDAGAQICLDADERIWVPDTFMYCIKAVDKAGNLMTRIGKYGNEDCRGGGGDKKLEGTNIIIDPEIPLARPQGMTVWKDYLFISDMYAHRVMRCKLEYADKKEMPLE